MGRVDSFGTQRLLSAGGVTTAPASADSGAVASYSRFGRGLDRVLEVDRAEPAFGLLAHHEPAPDRRVAVGVGRDERRHDRLGRRRDTDLLAGLQVDAGEVAVPPALA